jgi:hypothetical protein
MIIQARSIGRQVPAGDFQAVIHSVFQEAVNLYVQGLDHLVTVFASNDTDLPQGIRISRTPFLPFSQMRPGQEVARKGSEMMFPVTGLRVLLQDARLYSSRVRGLDCTPAHASQTAWETAWQTLDDRQVELGTDVRVQSDDTTLSPLGGRVTKGLDCLIRATRNQDLATAGDACEILVGLGVGLTPGGDDVLVGVLAGLWATCHGDPDRLQWVERLGSLVVSYGVRTNQVSRTYLQMAAMGEFSSSLSDLAAAICTGAPPGDVVRLSELVFQTGSTSGMDAATGLLAGLAAWNEPPEKNKP